jgi:hypothetical protein
MYDYCMRLRFRFRTIPFLATLVLVALGIALGNWQVRRAAEKTALQARLAQRSALPPLVLVAAPFRLPLDFGKEHRFYVAIAHGAAERIAAITRPAYQGRSLRPPLLPRGDGSSHLEVNKSSANEPEPQR